MFKVGDLVRVVEIHPDDMTPAHNVGDVLRPKLLRPFGDDGPFAGYYLMSHLTEDVRQRTICKLELVESADPPLEFDAGHIRTPFEESLDAVLSDIRTFLLAKNQAYGDSALNPVRAFSKSDRVEQLNVRIDDKISRLVRGSNAGEDVAKDLLGYLVMREIAMRGESK
jgi:hypothetical protein